MRISAVLVTYNEATKAERCLHSIKDFVDEIVIIDLESRDNIKAISDKYQAKLITHKRVPYVELIRNFSIAKTTGDWIIVLDPDEGLVPALCDYLRNVAKEDEYQAVNIPFKNIFWGKWIRHTNFWPDKHIRFFKRGSVIWQEKVHSYPIVSGKILEIPPKEELAIEHFGYDSKIQFIRKQLRYATSEATNLLSQGKRFSIFKLIWMPTREFLARFIKHQGFKDGLDGVFLVGALMVYQILVQLKLLVFQFSKKKRSF